MIPSKDMKRRKNIYPETKNDIAEMVGFQNIYNDIRHKLIGLGIPENEIAFIQKAKTDAKKADLFAKVRSGLARVLLGSTAMMGASRNVQTKLFALHHFDIGWKPSDLEQREGRILRQGNENDFVHIFRYITKGTFDAYMWQIMEQKQKFVVQIMTSKAISRTCEDIDETMLQFTEIKALSAGDPRVKEKMDLDVQVNRLTILKTQFRQQRYRLEDKVRTWYPESIAREQRHIQGLKDDIAYRDEQPDDGFCIIIGNKQFYDAEAANKAISTFCKAAKEDFGRVYVWRLQWLRYSFLQPRLFLEYHYSFSLAAYELEYRQSADHVADLQGLLKTLDNSLTYAEGYLIDLLERAKAELQQPFQYEDELAEKQVRLIKLNAELDFGKNDNHAVFDDKDP